MVVWICKACDWFIYEQALEFQKKIGIAKEPWRCPECKGQLEKEG
jgi:rubredoxin